MWRDEKRLLGKLVWLYENGEMEVIWIEDGGIWQVTLALCDLDEDPAIPTAAELAEWAKALAAVGLALKETRMDNLANIYAQMYWHEDAYIVADKQALARIIQACNDALTGGHGRADLYCNDGEGYELSVILLEDATTWEQMGGPYTEEVYDTLRDGILWPEDLLPKEQER